MKISQFKQKIQNHGGLVKTVKVIGSLKLLNTIDAIIDLKICGRSLVRYVPSPFRESRGSTGSQSTPYLVLKKIFNDYSFSENDRFIDIGCGKGRVLAHLIRSGFPGELYGVEMTAPVADIAKEWTSRYPNVKIYCDDAFNLNLNDYTVFFLGRPFLPDPFSRFIAKMESEIDHPITFFYWVDQQSGDYLNNRKGWKMLVREPVFKINSFYVASWPQRYSVWLFDPYERQK